jgi:hypothetical protein
MRFMTLIRSAQGSGAALGGKVNASAGPFPESREVEGGYSIYLRGAVAGGGHEARHPVHRAAQDALERVGGRSRGAAALLGMGL